MMHASSTALRLVRDTISNGVRGITLGLWTLTGLAFLTDVLLPGIGGFPMLAPWLLAASVAWTALIPTHGQHPRENQSLVLLLLGFALALAISFVLIHAGDRRSLLLIGFASLVVFLLAARASKNPLRSL